MDSETGKKCAEILNRGEAISEDMVLKMIEEKVNSPEVAHHGKLIITYNNVTYFTKRNY